MKKFQKPETEFIKLEMDVIATSGCSGMDCPKDCTSVCRDECTNH